VVLEIVQKQLTTCI